VRRESERSTLLPSAAMTSGDQGIDPYVRMAVAGVTGAVLLATVAAGTAVCAGGDDGSAAPTPALSPLDTRPAIRPAIRPERAFPETGVRLGSGTRYERVDLATTPDCAQGMSAEPAARIERGEGCLRLTTALFTDVERRSRVTVTVLSFRRAEDASTVFAAGMPTVPPGSVGVFRRLMTVRSVVFAHGRWSDGAETAEAPLARQTEELLRYAGGNVTAYEEGASATAL